MLTGLLFVWEVESERGRVHYTGHGAAGEGSLGAQGRGNPVGGRGLEASPKNHLTLTFPPGHGTDIFFFPSVSFLPNSTLWS